MAFISFFLLRTFTKLTISVLILHPHFCLSVFLSQNFEPCGIFLHDFQPYTSQQDDFIHEALEHLHLNQSRPTSLIIKNERSQTELTPQIFRSMNYDCFYNVHINFGKDLFSTIPSFENPVQKALYMRSVFLIFVEGNVHEMLNYESFKLQRDRQYTMFVFRVKMNPRYIPYRNKLFAFYKTYFFCTFCKPGLVRLFPAKTKNILSLKLSNFEKSWAPNFVQHYHNVDSLDLKNAEFCRQQNFLILYKVKAKCQRPFMLATLIAFASSKNFTLKPYQTEYYSYSRIPQIFTFISYYGFESKYKYSSPIYRKYEYPSIIYCFNSGRVTIAETNMWTKYVSVDIWILVGLCLLLSSILYTASGSPNKSPEMFLENIVLFFNSVLKFMGIILRQSWSYKWKLLAILELLFSALLCLYENAITVSVVVPLVPKPFVSTRELFNNNYTFVVQLHNSERLYNTLSNEYNTNNNRRVLEIDGFANPAKWLEKYFLRAHNDTKYAIVGFFSKNFEFQAVNFVKEKNETCYQMGHQENKLHPKPFFFIFTSAIESALYKRLSLLQAQGFLRVMEVSDDFRLYLLTLTSSKPLVDQYDKKINYVDVQNNRMMENMITLGNIKSVLYVGLVLILSFCVFFTA